MTQQLVVHVVKNGPGRYRAMKSYVGARGDTRPSTAIFTLAQAEGEDLQPFQERVLDHAKKLGINYIEDLN